MKKSKNGKRDLRLRIRAEKKLLKKFAATRQLHHKHVTVHQLLQKKKTKIRQIGTWCGGVEKYQKGV